MRLTLERRHIITQRELVMIAIISTVCSLLAFSIVFLEAGINPIYAYIIFFDHGFTTPGLYNTIQRTTILLFDTLAFIIPLTAGIWNLGVEGQFYMGAIGAIGTSYLFANMPSYIIIPIMIIASAVLGGIYALIPGYLKGKMFINETLTTLFLNYIVIFIVMYLCRGPWMGVHGLPISKPVVPAGRVPQIGDTGIPYTIFLAIGAAIAIYIFLKKTVLGYKIKLFGHNPSAARYAGMNFARIASMTMFLAGMVGGLAGFHQISGVIGTLRHDLSPGWGYYAIVFGLIANLNPISAIIVSFVLTGFLVGTESLYPRLGMRFGVVDLFIGVFCIVFICFQFLRNYRFKLDRGGR